MASGNHINDLPAEILQEILLWVVSYPKQLSWNSSNPNLIDFSSTPSSPYTANYRSPASPYSSSHVCKKWRYVACSFPHLWTHLCVVRPRKEDRSHLTRVWLARAGSFPFYLFLNEGPNALVGTKAVLKSFIDHIHKWKSFQMESRNGLDNLVEPDVMKTLPASPVLEHLSLTFYGTTGSTWPTPLIRILIQSPALRSVMLVSETPFLHFKHTWAPKWVNITELKLCADSHALSALLDGLSYCQNLQRLGIYGVILDWTPFDSKKQLVLPHLTHLSVPAYKSIITWLTLPSLSGLHLTMLRYTPMPWSSIAWSLNRSRASIEVLKVHYISGSFYEPDFIITLRRPYFQWLKVLEVEYPLTVQVVKFLRLPAKQGGPESERGFLPHLERLSLILQVPFRDDHRHEVEQLIKSRLGASSLITPRRCLQTSKAGMRFTLNIPAAD